MNAPNMANLLTFEQWISTYGYVSEDDGWWSEPVTRIREIESLTDLQHVEGYVWCDKDGSVPRTCPCTPTCSA